MDTPQINGLLLQRGSGIREMREAGVSESRTRPERTTPAEPCLSPDGKKNLSLLLPLLL